MTRDTKKGNNKTPGIKKTTQKRNNDSKSKHLNKQEDHLRPKATIIPIHRSKDASMTQNTKELHASSQNQRDATNSDDPFKQIENSMDIFHDKDKKTYATIDFNNCIRTLEICDEELSDIIRLLHLKQTNSVASKKSIKSFCEELSLKAKYYNPTKDVYQRFAHINGNIYIDLCDDKGTIIEISKSGWTTTVKSPVKFIRHSSMQQLPTPKRGGNITNLLNYLNISSENDGLLALTWLLVSTIHSIPRPILLLYGPPGACKTSALTAIRGLIDPTSPMCSYPSRTIKDSISYISSNAIPSLDNITNLSKEMENLLCMTTTGEGITLRKLYTNLKNITIRLKKPIIVTSLGIPTTARDLLDRAIPIQLERLTPSTRRDEASIKSELATHKPLLLGGMCDSLSRMLTAVESISIPMMPRLADYAKWGCAAAIALGYSDSDFLNAYWNSVLRAPCDPHDNYLFAQSFIKFLDSVGPFSNYVSIVLNMFNTYILQQGFHDDIVPKAANLFSRRLKEIVPYLEMANWKLTWSENARDGRMIYFSRVDHTEPHTQPESQTINPEDKD